MATAAAGTGFSQNGFGHHRGTSMRIFAKMVSSSIAGSRGLQAGAATPSRRGRRAFSQMVLHGFKKQRMVEMSVAQIHDGAAADGIGP